MKMHLLAVCSTGTGPHKTMFVVEFYGAKSKGPIHKYDRYQNDFMGLDVEVKDENRFPDKWDYFGFGADDHAAAATPSQNNCWKRHDQNTP
jgi:hypothetical protein